MNTFTQFDREIQERNDALVALDIEWARRQLFALSPARSKIRDEVLLLSLHKARHQCVEIPDNLRIESAKWLKDRGYKDAMNQPINDPARLPK